MTSGWSTLKTFASGFEADIAIARLEAEDIPAVRDSNDTTGIFGPNFQAATAHGVSVQVPTAVLEEARSVLRDFDEPDEPGDALSP